MSQSRTHKNPSLFQDKAFQTQLENILVGQRTVKIKGEKTDTTNRIVSLVGDADAINVSVCVHVCVYLCPNVCVLKCVCEGESKDCNRLTVFTYSQYCSSMRNLV